MMQTLKMELNGENYAKNILYNNIPEMRVDKLTF